MKFPKLFNAISKNYHGECFEGTACRKILKNAEKLSSRRVLGKLSPLLVQPYIRAFKAMDKFTHHCLSTRKLDPNIDPVSLLGEVIISYMDLGISVTLKIHVLFNHVLPALQYTAGRGLGHVSEQPVESAHQEFKNNFWSRYKVN